MTEIEKLAALHLQHQGINVSEYAEAAIEATKIIEEIRRNHPTREFGWCLSPRLKMIIVEVFRKDGNGTADVLLSDTIANLKSRAKNLRFFKKVVIEPVKAVVDPEIERLTKLHERYSGQRKGTVADYAEVAVEACKVVEKLRENFSTKQFFWSLPTNHDKSLPCGNACFWQVDLLGMHTHAKFLYMSNVLDGQAATLAAICSKVRNEQNATLAAICNATKADAATRLDLKPATLKVVKFKDGKIINREELFKDIPYEAYSGNVNGHTGNYRQCYAWIDDGDAVVYYDDLFSGRVMITEFKSDIRHDYVIERTDSTKFRKVNKFCRSF